MKTLPLLLSSLALGVLASSDASADRIWLKNGNYLEGSVAVLENGDVEVSSSVGSLTLPAASVVRVERAETLEQAVERIRATLPLVDAQALFELAEWCQAEGGRTLATRLLKEVIALDPDHAGARQSLGYRWFGGEWVDEERYRELRGEVYYRGEWMSPETRSQLLQLAAAQAHADAQRQRELNRDAQLRVELERLRLEQQRLPPQIPYHLLGASPLVPQVIVTPVVPIVPKPVVVPAAPRRRAPVQGPRPPRHHRGNLAPPPGS